MSRRLFAFVGAFALAASPALAHHPGGASNTGGAGPIVTISASTLEAGHGAIAFLYEYLAFGGLGDNGLIAAAGKHIHAHSIGTIQSASVSAAYGVTDDFMVSARRLYSTRAACLAAVLRAGARTGTASPRASAGKDSSAAAMDRRRDPRAQRRMARLRRDLGRARSQFRRPRAAAVAGGAHRAR